MFSLSSSMQMASSASTPSLSTPSADPVLPPSQLSHPALQPLSSSDQPPVHAVPVPYFPYATPNWRPIPYVPPSSAARLAMTPWLTTTSIERAGANLGRLTELKWEEWGIQGVTLGLQHPLPNHHSVADSLFSQCRPAIEAFFSRPEGFVHAAIQLYACLYREQQVFMQKALQRQINIDRPWRRSASKRKRMGDAEEAEEEEKDSLSSVIIPDLHLRTEDLRRIALMVYLYWRMAQPQLLTSGPMQFDAAMEVKVDTDEYSSAHFDTLEVFHNICKSVPPVSTGVVQMFEDSCRLPRTLNGQRALSIPRPIISIDPLLCNTYTSILQNNHFIPKAPRKSSHDRTEFQDMGRCKDSLKVSFFAKFIHATALCIAPLLILDIHHQFQTSFNSYSEHLKEEINSTFEWWYQPHMSIEVRPIHLIDVNSFLTRKPAKEETDAGRLMEMIVFGGEVFGVNRQFREYNTELSDSRGYAYLFKGLKCTIPPTSTQTRLKRFDVMAPKLREACYTIIKGIPCDYPEDWDLRDFSLEGFTNDERKALREMKESDEDEEEKAARVLVEEECQREIRVLMKGLVHARAKIEEYSTLSDAIERKLESIEPQRREPSNSNEE